MKWSTLLSKVVFAAGQQQERQQPPQPPPPPGSPLHRQQADQDLATPRLSSASAGGDEGGFDAAAGSSPSAAASPARWVPIAESNAQPVSRYVNRIGRCIASSDAIPLLSPSGFRNGDRIWIRGTFHLRCLLFPFHLRVFGSLFGYLVGRCWIMLHTNVLTCRIHTTEWLDTTEWFF